MDKNETVVITAREDAVYAGSCCCIALDMLALLLLSGSCGTWLYRIPQSVDFKKTCGLIHDVDVSRTTYSSLEPSAPLQVSTRNLSSHSAINCE